jgi:hypothetical protein
MCHANINRTYSLPVRSSQLGMENRNVNRKSWTNADVAVMAIRNAVSEQGKVAIG